MEAYLPYIIWGAIFVITVIIELVSQQLLSIWFSAGSLVAFITACFDGNILLQLILFVVVSLVLLLLTRPITRRFLNFRPKNTNHLEIGQIAVVIQTVDPKNQTGRVRLDDVDWIATTDSSTPIPPKTQVRVTAVEGARLCVSPIAN